MLCPIHTSKVFLLHKLVLWMDKQADEFLQTNFQISYIQFLIVMFLDQFPKITQKELADNLNCTQAAVSKQIEVLRAQEILKRKIDNQNRRQNLLYLTAKGKDLVEKTNQVLISKSEEMFEQILSKEEIESFHSSLSKLCKSFQKDCKGSLK